MCKSRRSASIAKRSSLRINWVRFTFSALGNLTSTPFVLQNCLLAREGLNGQHNLHHNSNKHYKGKPGNDLRKTNHPLSLLFSFLVELLYGLVEFARCTAPRPLA